jgi:type IV pilus assembly protein PilN
MIRINLLAGERRAAPATGGGGSTFQMGQKMTVLGSLILVVTLLLLGWRYWSIEQEKARVASDIDAARREETRLAEVLKQVQEFEARKAMLQARIALIDELKRGQSAPVHMVDQISRALPDMTWLTTLKQNNLDITIEGRTLTLASVSDFVGNLEASRVFVRPVEIIDSAVLPAVQGGPELIRFVVRGTFQMSGMEPTPAPDKPGAKPPVKGGKVG